MIFIIIYLYELFPDFICANNIGSLVNDLFGVKTFHPVPSFTSSSSLSKGGMSTDFCLLNFTLSAINSSGCDLLFSFLFNRLNL